MSKSIYVVFTGTASVGKSTLIKPVIPMLEEMYGEPVVYIAEVARSLEKKGFKINKEATSQTQRLIEDEYLRLEQENINRIKIADRSVIDRFSYTMLNGGNTIDEQKRILLDWYDANIETYCAQYSHIFHIPLTADVPLELDGVRSPDEMYRREIDAIQKNIIDMYKIKVHVVTGTVEQRLATIMNVLEKTRDKV